MQCNFRGYIFQLSQISGFQDFRFLDFRIRVFRFRDFRFRVFKFRVFRFLVFRLRDFRISDFGISNWPIIPSLPKKNPSWSTLKPQNRQKIIIRIIDKIIIYYSIDFVDYSILSITIICRIIDKKMELYTCGLV